MLTYKASSRALLGLLAESPAELKVLTEKAAPYCPRLGASIGHLEDQLSLRLIADGVDAAVAFLSAVEARPEHLHEEPLVLPDAAHLKRAIQVRSTLEVHPSLAVRPASLPLEHQRLRCKLG